LKSWLVLDNHVTGRLNTDLPQQWQQRMAQILQFALPGSPCVCYGVELGLSGGADPEQRGPFRWDHAKAGNPYFDWFQDLVEMRRNARALKIGDFRLLGSESLLAFQRFTNHVAETRIVVANPLANPVNDLVSVRDARIMNHTVFKDVFSAAEVVTDTGSLLLSVPAQTTWVLRPETTQSGDYTPYKRIR